MQNINYLSLINFKLKLYCQRHFFINENRVHLQKNVSDNVLLL